MSSDNGAKPNRRLGVGFIGSGFNARFHMQAFRGVRDADVFGVWSPNKKNAASAAELARSLDVGPAKPYASGAWKVSRLRSLRHRRSRGSPSTYAVSNDRRFVAATH